MNVPISIVVTLLLQYKCDKYGIILGDEVWLSKDKYVIRFPANCKEIHTDLLEAIAIEILGMSIWEYDYFLGQNGIA